jgi:hypothetical protein
VLLSTASQLEAALSLRFGASECTVLTFAPAVRSDGIRMSLTPGYPGIALTRSIRLADCPQLQCIA